MRRLRNLFTAVWLLVMFVGSFINTAFVLGSFIGWALCGLTMTAYAAQIEAEQNV